MRVYLMRHGLAVHPVRDPDEPLSDQGRDQVRRVVDELKTRGIRPRWIRHSPRTRAVQTAALLAEILAADVPVTEDAGLLPDGDVEDLARFLARVEPDGFVVGHMPCLSDLVHELVDPDTDGRVVFPTAGVVCLEGEATGPWEVRWMIEP